MKARLCQDLGRDEEAISFLNEVLTLDPEHSEAKKELERMQGNIKFTAAAVEAFKEGRFGDAIGSLDQLLNLDLD